MFLFVYFLVLLYFVFHIKKNGIIIKIQKQCVFMYIDKGKFILGAPPKLDKKGIKNPRAKKGNTQKPK